MKFRSTFYSMQYCNGSGACDIGRNVFIKLFSLSSSHLSLFLSLPISRKSKRPHE